jgi:hypothetical protein
MAALCIMVVGTSVLIGVFMFIVSYCNLSWCHLHQLKLQYILKCGVLPFSPTHCLLKTLCPPAQNISTSYMTSCWKLRILVGPRMCLVEAGVSYQPSKFHVLTITHSQVLNHGCISVIGTFWSDPLITKKFLPVPTSS